MKLKVELKDCDKKCCLKELDTKLTLKVFLPNVGDRLEGIAGWHHYTFTVTAQNQANFRQHEQQHVIAHYRIAGALCPKMEKDCIGRCETRWFGRKWTAESCEDWWQKEIDEELGWVKNRMYEAGAEFDSRTRYFNEHVSLTQQFINDYSNYVTQELAKWGKHRFCD